jgi:hypothetical protein
MSHFWSCRDLNSPTLERTESSPATAESRKVVNQKNWKYGKSKSGKTESGKFASCLLQDEGCSHKSCGLLASMQESIATQYCSTRACHTPVEDAVYQCQRGVQF